MNWEAVAAIGQAIGAIAVVVSIVYLAMQIRANTRAVRGQAGFDATHSWAQSNETMGQMRDDVLRLLVESGDPAKTASWSEIDHYRVSLIMRSVLQKLEGQYFLYVNGILDPGLWEQRRAIARGMIASPYTRALWENEVAVRTFSPAFVDVVETASDSIDYTRITHPAESH